MNFFEFLDKLKRNYNSLILYCLLDRIPVVVLGEDSDKIDNFLIELSELVHFRKDYVFYTDFISTIDYETLISNENIDYNCQRAHIRCPCISKILFNEVCRGLFNGAIKIFAFFPSIRIYFKSFGCK